jgi:hypothetical protein
MECKRTNRLHCLHISRSYTCISRNKEKKRSELKNFANNNKVEEKMKQLAWQQGEAS